MGKTSALADSQARLLLDALDAMTDMGRAPSWPCCCLRRAELCALNVGDLQERRGLKHLRVQWKGGKLQYVPLHPARWPGIQDYLAQARHAGAKTSALFLALRNPSSDGRLRDKGIYTNVVLHYGRPLKFTDLPLFCPHSMRGTAATNALLHGAGIVEVQEGLGHANIQTTRV